VFPTVSPLQEEAVSAIARAIRRARVGLKNPNRPIASFIFAGPTGVGKSELAKTLASYYFGSEEAMVSGHVHHLSCIQQGGFTISRGAWHTVQTLCWVIKATAGVTAGCVILGAVPCVNTCVACVR
jgi:hypothetical protein